MAHRFFCPQLVESGSVSLQDTEFHHLVHVMRASTGDQVELFRGDGLVAAARVGKIGKSAAEMQVLNSHREPAPEVDLTIATAVPKGDRFAWLIEKATEIGVSRIIPIVTERSVVDPRDSKLDKMRQASISACKQCGRNDLMDIAALMSWKDFLRSVKAEEQFLIAHPFVRKADQPPTDGPGLPNTSTDVSSHPQRLNNLTIAIGPEGGFSDSELQAALALGGVPIQLGNYILRIETAVVVAAARYLS